MIVPATFHDLLHHISRLLHRDRFTVFGGAARDLLTDESAPIHDLDIAVDGTRADADQLAERLTRHPGVTHVTPVRDYWIFYRRPLSMFTADLGGLTLDINVMACPLWAHFDVETVQWQYPGMTVDDPHAVAARPVEHVRLLGCIDDDNPVLMLNRLLRLAAKYDLPLTGQPHTATLRAKAARWRSSDRFHGHDAHHAHHRAVADAVMRSPDPPRFLTDCLHSEVLDARLAPLARVLRSHPARIGVLAAQPDRRSWWGFADTLVGDPSAAWREHHPVADPTSATVHGRVTRSAVPPQPARAASLP